MTPVGGPAFPNRKCTHHEMQHKEGVITSAD